MVLDATWGLMSLEQAAQESVESPLLEVFKRHVHGLEVDLAVMGLQLDLMI